MSKVGLILDGKYEILKEIGQGGMSIVYVAMDNRLNKQWAVKELKNDGSQSVEMQLKGIEREANILKKVDHPVLPRIVDIIDKEGTVYVVMDYIQGLALDRILKEEGAQQVVNTYDKLIEGYHAFAQEDTENAGNLLAEVNPDLLSESARNIYNEMNSKVNEQFVASAFEKGERAYNSQNYEEAVTELEKVVQIEEDYDDGNAIYYLAQSYRKLEDMENAKKYYQRMVELHPGTERARTSQNYLDEMSDEGATE